MSRAYPVQPCPDLNKLAIMQAAPFQFYVWPQHLLMLGPGHASGQHRHQAAQIAFGLDGPVTFESPHTGLLSADMLLVAEYAARASCVRPIGVSVCISGKQRMAKLSRPGRARSWTFNFQPATAFFCAPRRGRRCSRGRVVGARFDRTVPEPFPERRCAGLSRRHAHRPESRGADHVSSCGQGHAPIAQPAGTPLPRSDWRAVAALRFVVPAPHGGGIGDARSEPDRSGSPRRIRRLCTSVAYFPRDVRSRAVFAV